MNYYKAIDKLKNIGRKEKEGYKWLFCNFEAVQRAIKEAKPKTVGDVRKACWQEIGFMPALLFSFSHLFQDKSTYLKALQKSLNY